MPKFKDIKSFITCTHYECDVSWDYLLRWLEMINEHNHIKLNPDFQREHVWTEEQRERYVEYILRDGISSRDIYWNCVDQYKKNNPIILVDGKQRLETATRFVNNQTKAFGHYFGEYEDKLGILVTFRMRINNLKTRAELLQWYIDLNAGGVVHTDEEIERVRKLLEQEKQKVK